MDEHPSPRERTLKLQKRVFDFTVSVLRACPKTRMDISSTSVWSQLVKASVGAVNNLEEADAASSRADFRAKMRIALREAKESSVCLRLLAAAELKGHHETRAARQEAWEIAAIFHAIVKKVS